MGILAIAFCAVGMIVKNDFHVPMCLCPTLLDHLQRGDAFRPQAFIDGVFWHLDVNSSHPITHYSKYSPTKKKSASEWVTVIKIATWLSMAT
jgi:hypothetical protein